MDCLHKGAPHTLSTRAMGALSGTELATGRWESPRALAHTSNVDPCQGRLPNLSKLFTKSSLGSHHPNFEIEGAPSTLDKEQPCSSETWQAPRDSSARNCNVTSILPLDATSTSQDNPHKTAGVPLQCLGHDGVAQRTVRGPRRPHRSSRSGASEPNECRC